MMRVELIDVNVNSASHNNGKLCLGCIPRKLIFCYIESVSCIDSPLIAAAVDQYGTWRCTAWVCSLIGELICKVYIAYCWYTSLERFLSVFHVRFDRLDCMVQYGDVSWYRDRIWYILITVDTCSRQLEKMRWERFVGNNFYREGTQLILN